MSGIVPEDVEPAKGVFGGTEQGLQLGFLRHVAMDIAHPVLAEARFQCLALFILDVAGHDIGAGFNENLNPGQTDAAGCACNDGCLSR